MGRRHGLLGHRAAILALTLLFAPSMHEAQAQSTLVPATMSRADIAGRGADAEHACRSRPEPACLATVMLARIAAGARAPNTHRIAQVMNRLAASGDVEAARSLLPMAVSVAAIIGAPRPDVVLRDIDALTYARASLLAEARSVAAARPDPLTRAQATLSIAAAAPTQETLREARDAVSGFVGARRPSVTVGNAGIRTTVDDGLLRAAATDWLDVLEAAHANDASRVAMLLDAIAHSPHWPASLNVDPSMAPKTFGPAATTFFLGESDGFRVMEFASGILHVQGDVGWMRIVFGDGQGYDGMRNLPRLKAFAALALGDPRTAILAAREIRYPLAQVSMLAEIRRRHPALQTEIDAMVVAIAHARPTEPGLQHAAFGALLRLDRLDEAERLVR